MQGVGWRTRWSIRWARWRRWEFWPGPLFYVPVVAYISARTLLTGQLTRFTAVNPGISHAGGLIGEGKDETLVPLAARAADFVAPFELVEADLAPAERTARALAFAQRLGRPWPLVIKPNRGERGRGVRIAHSEGAVRDYFNRMHLPAIVQAYAPGQEYGLFFVRRPGEPGGLVSITEKRFPKLRGDGRRTLGALILDDARGRLISPLLFERFSDSLDRVPGADETIPMADVGSHCRGALFLDAKALDSEALTARVRALADAIPGFHFGRFDVRAQSADALVRGEGFQVIEVNGASSEPAHVYHPGTPLLEGLRSFFGIWRDMMDIGAANAQAGAPWIRPFDLAAMAWRENGKLRGVDWPSNLWSGDRPR